jgi:hypothetical protein
VATRTPQKRENVQIAEINARVQNVAQMASVAKTGLTGWIAFECVRITVDGFRSIVQANPDAITALAKVVENFHLSGIVGSLVGLAGVSYGMYERRGKKRLLPGYSQQRKHAERNDLHNESSGLNELGETPH